MIISVHIPKTAGTSFKYILSKSSKKLCLHYEQKPLLYRSEKREIKDITINKDCNIFHGHFIADSINDINEKDIKYIVWLRNPVDRVVSHYNHWKRHVDLNQPISKSIAEDNLNLKDFSKIEAMQNVQSFFLGKMKLEEFSFVGIKEKFEESISIFNNTFDFNLNSEIYLNVNPTSEDKNYKEIIGNELYEFIKNQNQKDLELYNLALELMRTRK